MKDDNMRKYGNVTLKKIPRQVHMLPVVMIKIINKANLPENNNVRQTSLIIY